jgi:RES domain-containing protein
MRYFRLYEKVLGRNPLGYGRAGGRWNRPGMPMIYLSNYSSTNFLELLSIRGPFVTAVNCTMAVYNIDQEVPMLSLNALPENWNSLPHSSTTQALGETWIREAGLPFLIVPSARLPLQAFPAEHNLLVNPLFPDFGKSLKVEEIWEVDFLLNS